VWTHLKASEWITTRGWRFFLVAEAVVFCSCWNWRSRTAWVTSSVLVKHKLQL